ncbi:suppressor of fused homolog isoform X2 [Ixodes scapularis]|uniref:suppressor of fused homolog isoform X2 n=1 Tax=Ixodes scapularis TaxID=6945 RepID=UPI001C385FF7|nr:suppressor of fused homolog isoform X2 [Ixodes scapularis]
MDSKRMAGAPQNFPVVGFPQIPPGLEALYSSCLRIYNDQPNPLQVAAVLKYWLGGPDPLDYISMYANQGDESKQIPAHWHYVSFGLSDLHGDGRVHEISNADSPSGFGFELTFRLRKEPDETGPPTWPAAVMQGLAKYVFQTGNVLCDGDHVSWHCPLDNSESRIEHMLMMEDPQLGTVNTPFGVVSFIQIVGVCAEELKAAQQWNGRSFVALMQRVPGAGGPWLVTDMRRGETVFELDPGVQDAVDRGIETEGSDLSGVSAKFCWSEEFPPVARRAKEQAATTPADSPSISHYESEEIKRTLKKGLLGSQPSSETEWHHSRRGRLKHGRHFTFKSSVDCAAVTFVVPTVIGAFANAEQPYAVQGSWLQVLLTEDLVSEMTARMEELCSAEGLTLPKTYTWPERKMSITLMPEEL